MTKFVLPGMVAVLAVAAMLPAPVMAQPTHSQPGSFLIYPLFNSTSGNNTVICVTNTNQDEGSCGNGFRQGDVRLHFVYTDGTTWAESNLDEDLTPADQIVVLARGHNPNQEEGFLTVEARDPESGFPIDYDEMIGSAHIVNSEFDFEWAYTPYSFEGNPAAADSGRGMDDCGRFFTDTDAFTPSTVDFDGFEYSTFPDLLYLDQFFGEGTPAAAPGVTFSNSIYLMATSPSVTNMRLLGWNNNERRFSRTFSFNCWTEASLGQLTQAVTQANLDVDGDDSELNGVNTGWLQLEALGASTGVLGVFVQQSSIGAEVHTAGRELQYEGSRVTTLPRFPF